MPERFDRAELMPPMSTPEGFLLAEGFAAKPGVYQYQMADGSTIRELVTAEVLADRDSLATLGRATVTLTHPPEMVRSDNVKEYGVGDVDGDIEVDDRGFVRIKVAVRREDAVSAVRAGTRELSCGYIADVDPTPGFHPKFGEYDQSQTARRYNHLAIVPLGRHGFSVALRADAATMVSAESNQAPPSILNKGGNGMRHATLIAALVLAGMTEERANELGPKVAENLKPEDLPDEPRSDSGQELATALGEKRVESLRADKAEAELTELKVKFDAIDEAAIARAYIEDQKPLREAAERLEVKFDAEATNADVREAIAKSVGVEVEHVDSIVKAINKSPAVKRDARYDGLTPKEPTGSAKGGEEDPFAVNERIDRGETINTDKEV